MICCSCDALVSCCQCQRQRPRTEHLIAPPEQETAWKRMRRRLGLKPAEAMKEAQAILMAHSEGKLPMEAALQEVKFVTTCECPQPYQSPKQPAYPEATRTLKLQMKVFNRQTADLRKSAQRCQ